MGIFCALREMGTRFPVSWSVEGALWFCDLGAADSFAILPLAVGTATCANCLYAARFQPDPKSQMLLRVIGCTFGAASVPIMCYLGSGVNLYVVSNIFSGMLLSASLRQPALRKAWGLKPINAGKHRVDENGNLVAITAAADAGSSTSSS